MKFLFRASFVLFMSSQAMHSRLG